MPLALLGFLQGGLVLLWMGGVLLLKTTLWSAYVADVEDMDTLRVADRMGGVLVPIGCELYCLLQNQHQHGKRSLHGCAFFSSNALCPSAWIPVPLARIYLALPLVDALLFSGGSCCLRY